MKRKLSVLSACCIGIVLLLTSNFAFAQKKIPFTIDAATFHLDEGNALWELYYAFPDTSMKYVAKNNKYVGEMYIDVEIVSATKTVASAEWIVANESASPVVQHAKNLVGVKSFALPPGQYTAKFTIADLSRLRDTLKEEVPIVVANIPRNRLSLSEIEFATEISPVAELPSGGLTPSFQKNSLYVVPNPFLTYNATSSTLTFYTEIYKAKTFAPNGIHLRYTVFNAVRGEIFSFDKAKESVGDALVEFESVPIDALPSGVYVLQITAYNEKTNPTDSGSVRKKFYVVNTEMSDDGYKPLSQDEAFQASEFVTMGDERLADEFAKFKCFGSKYDITFYESLTEREARQKALFRFWWERDPTPKTLENEKREEFLENVKYANQYFSNLQRKEGWKSDRGRILLKYGKPDHIERSPYSPDMRPFEIWSYNSIQGGVEFAFVDKSGYNNFILVHSTAQSEVREPDWQSRHARIVNESGTAK